MYTYTGFRVHFEACVRVLLQNNNLFLSHSDHRTQTTFLYDRLYPWREFSRTSKQNWTRDWILMFM